MLVAWLLVLAAIGASLALGMAWLMRPDPFDPGRDGFWRDPLRRTHWGVRVEPELVRLHARAGSWETFIGLWILGVMCVTTGAYMVRPFALKLPLSPRMAREFQGLELRLRVVVVNGVALAAGTLLLVDARRRTDLILESQGDLRWHHHMRREPDGAVAPAAFDGLEVEADGGVYVRFLDGRPRVRVFGLRGKPREDDRSDVRRASDAFRALAARRAGAAPPPAP